MSAGHKPSPEAVSDYLLGQTDRLVDLLHRMTLAESPSDDPGAQQAIREIIAVELEKRDFLVRRIPGRTSGGMLHARPRRGARGRANGTAAQLVLGHFDTVWPLGTLEQMPFERDGDIVRGPGVYDMKGGVAMVLLALDALAHTDATPAVTPHLFFNSDEEIGSRESRRYIERLAPVMNRVLVLEPSLGPQGHLKTARKGIGRFTVMIDGQAAHAGLDPGAGASAILELSHQIQVLFALNDHDRGVTVNVGTIDGGLRPNVVAPRSRAVVDVRVATSEDAKRIEDAIFALQAHTPGTRVSVEGGFGRPPMEPTPANQQLWRLASRLSKALGFKLEQAAAGGGSDGNFTSRFTATLDGLGAVGDGAHARHEHLCLSATLERTALLTLLLAEPEIESGIPEVTAA